MEGLLHLFDFNQSSTSRKSVSSKNQDGMDAPRNSLELPTETAENNVAVGESIPYSYKVMQNILRSSNYNSSGAPMKKLIDEEISKEPDVRRNVPSVVARLMGMDTLPSDARPAAHVKTKEVVMTQNNLTSKEQVQNASVRRSRLGLKHSKQMEDDLPYQVRERENDKYDDTLKYEKPRPREHPQEEQLQKFKKEFEAWQAARVWEHARVIENEKIPRQWFAREELNQQYMALRSDPNKTRAIEKPIKLQGQTSQHEIGKSSHGKHKSQHQGYINEPVKDVRKESLTSGNRSRTDENKQVYSISHEHSKSYAPTRIVILKPGPDTSSSRRDSWASSSEIVEEEGSMEDFLEEVKERLRFEMRGKSVKKDNVVRGSGIETPFSEKASSPRQIARSIANEIRESVSRDYGVSLTRSESTRSYRSEIQVNGPGSPEFMDRDTRILLQQRLRNVLKDQSHQEKETLRQPDALKGDIYWENVNELQSSSFGHGQQNDAHHVEDVSPRNLVRSMSAPVSGTAFGKLLLEDRHVLTGAHIRRRQEASENVTTEARKTKKENLGFKGKVSNLRCKFNFKGKLFGRRVQSVEESWTNLDSVNDIMSGPTVMANIGGLPDNSTEVPPSPASVCSSSHEEFCRVVEHPSPISTLDVPMIEDHVMPKACHNISSNLCEVRRELNQLESDTFKDTANVEEPEEAETVVLGPAEAYIKNLLMVSGFYDGSSAKAFTECGPMTKPLGSWVFENVEENYRKGTEEKIQIDRNILFDLSNEALAYILGPNSTVSTFKKNAIRPNTVPPCRKELLDSIWKMIHIYVSPQNDGLFYSMDSLVSRDLNTAPWSGIMHADVDAIGKDIEILILGKLIEETVREMWL